MEPNDYKAESIENISDTDTADKKKKRAICFALLIVAVLVVAGVAVSAAYGYIRKAMMSTEEYYRYVEQKNRDAQTEVLSDYYDIATESLFQDEESLQTSMKLTASDSAKALLSTGLGVDFSEIGDIGLEAVQSRSGNTQSIQEVLTLDGESIATINIYFDADEKQMYYQIPELSESYLDYSDSFASASEEEWTWMRLSQWQQYIPKTKTINSIINRYSDILIESAQTVEKTEETLETQNVSQETEAYTVSYDSDDAKKLGKELLQTAKDDEELADVIKNVSQSAYEDYEQSLEEALSALDSKSFDTDGQALTAKAYVGKRDVIVGREISINPGEDADTLVFRALFPYDGEQFGCLLSCTVGDVTYVTVEGSGTFKSMTLDGEFTVGIDESLVDETSGITNTGSLLKLTIEDCDISEWSKGKCAGTVTLSTDSVAELANYSLRIQTEGTTKEAESVWELLAGKDTLVTMEATSRKGGKGIDAKPDNNAVIYDVTNEVDLLAYQNEISLDSFLEKLQEKTGIDLTSLYYGGLL